MTGIERLEFLADVLADNEKYGAVAANLREIAAQITAELTDREGYESDVLAWVEESGGLDAVKERTMPEGMEWPFYEDGEPVRLGEHWQQDEYDWSITSIDSIEFAEDGVRFENEYADAFYRYGERVKRPAPPVLDADGVEIRVGDTVYLLPGDWCNVFPCLGYHGCEELEVFSLHADHVDGCVCCRDTRRPKGTCYPRPSQLTHQRPVLAADGKPLREGETVWDTNGDELVIGAFEDGGHTVNCRYADVGDAIPVHGMWSPSDLTHERPDSWERIEEDAGMQPHAYCVGHMLYGGEDEESTTPTNELFARDLVRRAKKLAERGE